MWPGVTRFSLVCLRFDDYNQRNDLSRWRETLSTYAERGARGLVAVSPKYEGERLAADATAFLDDLQDQGWEIAQHGYTHEDVGEGRSGRLYHDRSEFAGLPIEEQERRVGAGLDVLRDHGFRPTTFVPPWHEYDRNTVRALASLGFDCLNEGRWPCPRTIDGVTLVPTHVPWFTPSRLALGVVTVVAHPHLDDDPRWALDVVAGHEDRLRTPGEIAEWWRNRSRVGAVVDRAEPLYARWSA